MSSSMFEMMPSFTRRLSAASAAGTSGKGFQAAMESANRRASSGPSGRCWAVATAGEGSGGDGAVAGVALLDAGALGALPGVEESVLVGGHIPAGHQRLQGVLGTALPVNERAVAVEGEGFDVLQSQRG